MAHIGTTGIIILITGLNILGAKAVGKAEEWVVAFKISILMVYIGGDLECKYGAVKTIYMGSNCITYSWWNDNIC